jgi:DNA-binding transcriptional LysR family regulator
VALASTWLVPRLPRFAKLHPDIDLRLIATNDKVGLTREHIDVAIRFATLQVPAPTPDKLFDYKMFPVCAPSLARRRTPPLRTAADLSKHVLVDFETQVYGNPWYDWQTWFGAMKLRSTKGAGWLRFSHYDQVIEAARNGGGVAVGKWPHLMDHLNTGVLVAPLGEAGVATVGGFYLDVADSAHSDAAQRDAVQAFVRWLRAEAPADDPAKASAWRPPRRRATRAA